MKIIIEGTEKEIANLINELQGQRAIDLQYLVKYEREVNRKIGGNPFDYLKTTC